MGYKLIYDKKKILIVGRSFYPMNSPRSFRTTELVKEFARQGHEVTLLTIKNNDIHIPFEKDFNITIKDLGKMIFPPVKVEKANKLMKFITRGLRRGLELFLRYPEIELMFKVKAALKKEKGYDILISIAAPHPVHWGTAWAWNPKKNIAKTWIADCGDPFMGQENDTFKPAFYFKYIEKWFCKKADYITVPTEGAIQAYYPEFRDKIRVIPQGFRFEDIKLSPLTKNNNPHFAYAGGLIPGRRDPKEFFEFLVNYAHPFKFDVYTNQISLIKSYAERSNGRIEVKEYLPREELLYELSKLDFVVNFENAGQKQIPSKIIDYVIIKKPILSINSFNFNKSSAEEFLSGKYKNALVIENPDQYKIENIVKKFLHLVSN